MARIDWTRHARRVVLAPLPLLLVCAGCGHTAPPATVARATATSALTATPVPPLTLTWLTATAPPGSDPEAEPPWYLVAPSDVRVTYACAFRGNGARVWATRDRGATWSRGVDLAYAGLLSECVLVVDANDPLRVIAWLNTAKMGASPGPGNVVAFLSLDGGATWRALPKAGPHVVLSFTSSDGVIYAGGNGLDASGNWIQDLWASRDGGATWRALNAVHLTPNVRIWTNPRTGELLGFNDFDSTLWRSDDGGVDWRRVPTPALPGGAGQSYVVSPQVNGWLICAFTTYGSSQNTPNRAACSDDLGATWVGAPVDIHSEYSPKGFTFTVSSDVLAVTDTGSLLAVYVDASGERVEALAPGAGGWATVNPPSTADSPGAGYVYCSGPGAGALWVMSSDSVHPFSSALYP